ncbi:MAG: hypothetical protein ACP5DY_08785, partial [Thermovirgaceae bacterium]
MNFLRKKQGKLVRAVLVVVLAAMMAGTVAADEAKPIVSVGGEKVREEELISLVVRQSGVQKQMMPFVLARMTLQQREALVDQVVTSLLLSQAAAMEGLYLDEEVELTLRWNRANILAQAYINKIAQDWSFKRE